MVKLFVIGNGFDLHHHLKTGYKDFHDYVKANHSDKISIIENEFGLKTDKEWNELELTVSKTAMRDIYGLYTELKGKIPDTDREKRSAVYKSMAEDVEKPYIYIKDLLREWIAHVDSYGDNDVPALNYISITENDYCLNFNYTLTIEKLYIPLEGKAFSEYWYSHMCHIHGTHPNFIIFGHNEPVGSDLDYLDPISFEGEGLDVVIHCEDDPMVDWSDNELRMALNRLKKALIKGSKEQISRRKDFFKAICDVDEIIIYGWSLGECDWIYMDEILKNLKDQKILCVINSDNSKLNYEKYFEKNPNERHRLSYVTWDDLKSRGNIE